jgi:XTP/dITP diphosphohydrolase
MSTDTQTLQKVVLASSNPGKLNEFRELLTGVGFEVLPLSDFTSESAVESGLSFVENAIIKARFACLHSGLPAIADDSGLEVDALGGQPGIYSSRFSGDNATDASNNQKLLNTLEGLTIAERSARFQCLLVFMNHAEDPTPLICQGSWDGYILHEATGSSGFGYDPLFFVPEKQCSSAQLSKQEKNAISHRGKALRQLLERLANR